MFHFSSFFFLFFFFIKELFIQAISLATFALSNRLPMHAVSLPQFLVVFVFLLLGIKTSLAVTNIAIRFLAF